MLRHRIATIVIAMPLLLAPAEAASPWRFWTKADGLKQSVVSGVTADKTGKILVKFPDFSVEAFDGYQIAPVSKKSGYGRLFLSPNGDIWTFDATGINIRDARGMHHYPDSDITRFARTSTLLHTSAVAYPYYRGPEDRIDVAPLSKDLGIIMFPDRIVEWNRSTQRKRVVREAAGTGLGRFRDLSQARDGGIWIGGATGIAHLRKNGEAYQWTELPSPLPLTDLVNPAEGNDGEVLVSAQRSDGKRVLARFADGAWTQLYVGSGTQLKAWRGPEGGLWVQDERKILQLGDTPTRDLLGDRDINGLTAGVLAQPSRPFWLATTQGLARYSLPLWRTAPDLGWAETSVSVIAGDQQGRIWFVSGGYLGEIDHGKVRRFQLPSGRRTALLTERIAILDNGEVAMRAGSLADLAVFNPASGRFRLVRHPDGKEIGWIAARRAGNMWVQVFEKHAAGWNLESFDGTRFHPEGLPEFHDQMNLRALLDARNGDLWLGFSLAAGSNSFLGRIRNGKFQPLGKKDGFADTGVFAFLEKPDGRILIGGREKLTEYDGKAFHALKKADMIEGLALGRDGSIWTAAGSGIHRLRAGSQVTNTAEDGLPSTASRQVYSDTEGRIWAGTTRGISLFHPEADPDPPMTKIIDDRNLRETPPGGDVRLTFSGVDKWKFTAPDRLTFSWRMDGSEWSPFRSSQFVSFRHLHPGGHQFEVRAMDRNGNIEPVPAAYHVSVLFPWYLQKEVLVLAAIAMAVIFYLARMAWLHHRRVTWQSRHDPLTGLSNRNVFEANFQEAIAEARSSDAGVAMILLDLDRFKSVNDTLGHGAGDAFLREASARLQRTVRRQDTLARMGGDEFAILMPAIGGRAEAEAMAQRALDVLRQPYYIEAYELTGSASVGVSLFPDHGDDAATLQRLADVVMYQCKARNKDEYAVFDPDARGIDFRSAQMAGLIREALECEYFEINYQPVKDMTGRLLGLEALLRLRHPRYGTIAPNDFIGIAEDTGLIVRVGNWVLREACRQTAEWHREGHDWLGINVNVSAVQLAKRDFVESVTSVLRETGLNPRSLSLELTETALMQNPAACRSKIEQLRSMGIRIALDDFGTGYSSLSSLHLLPIDSLKIDRSFVVRIGETARGLAVVGKIVELGHEFGLEVVAEGVETETQLAALGAAGCNAVQGFLIGEPVSAKVAQVIVAADSRESARRMSRIRPDPGNGYTEVGEAARATGSAFSEASQRCSTAFPGTSITRYDTSARLTAAAIASAQ